MGKRTENEKKEASCNEPSPLVANSKRVKNVEDAKNLLSRLISLFCKGQISGRDAKDLCYLLSQYVAITKDVDFEERLIALEQKAGLER
jgi:hypothetical protein